MITSEEQYKAALARIWELMDVVTTVQDHESDKGQEFIALCDAVDEYENRIFLTNCID